MKVFLKISALVVLLLAASIYTNAQVADTVRYQPIPDYPVSYPTYKPKPQPNYYPFFNNGVTGIGEVLARITGSRYVSLRDYHGAKQFSYAESLTEHLSMLNEKYNWGFASVNIDTVIYILNHSREVYEPFGKGDYTIFYFDRNGEPMPRSIGSGNEPDKLIVFNNIAFVHCPTGGLMEPALLTKSYPARQKIEKKEPLKETESNWFPDWLKSLLLILAGAIAVILLLSILIWALQRLFNGFGPRHRGSIIILMPPSPPAPPVTPINIKINFVYRSLSSMPHAPKPSGPVDSSPEKPVDK